MWRKSLKKIAVLDFLSVPLLLLIATASLHALGFNFSYIWNEALKLILLFGVVPVLHGICAIYFNHKLKSGRFNDFIPCRKFLFTGRLVWVLVYIPAVIGSLLLLTLFTCVGDSCVSLIFGSLILGVVSAPIYVMWIISLFLAFIEIFDLSN